LRIGVRAAHHQRALAIGGGWRARTAADGCVGGRPGVGVAAGCVWITRIALVTTTASAKASGQQNSSIQRALGRSHAALCNTNAAGSSRDPAHGTVVGTVVETVVGTINRIDITCVHHGARCSYRRGALRRGRRTYG
jgi:hypothetical protein